jgi:hypothetical protein
MASIRTWKALQKTTSLRHTLKALHHYDMEMEHHRKRFEMNQAILAHAKKVGLYPEPETFWDESKPLIIKKRRCWLTRIFK